MNQTAVNNEQYIRDLYFNPESPVAYTNISKLWSKIKADKRLVKYTEFKAFLESLPTYQLHKPAIKKHVFRKTMASYYGQQFQADLVDMQKYEKDNKHYRFILTVTDIFSRYSWALALKSKRGIEVKELFVEIFKDEIPEKIQFDEGKEFYNKDLKGYLEENNVEWFSTYSDKKAAVV